MIRTLAAAVVAACLTLPALAADDPIVVAVKAKVKKSDLPFTMVVTVKVKPGAGEKFEALFEPARKATRTEPGNVTYQLSRDPDDATKYLVYERWKTVAALESHMKADHVVKLFAAVGEFLDGAPEVKVLIAVGD